MIAIFIIKQSSSKQKIGIDQLCNPSEDNCISGTKCTRSTGDKFVCKQILKIGQECKPNKPKLGIDYLDKCDKSEGLTCKETNETICGTFTPEGGQECFVVYRCQK